MTHTDAAHGDDGEGSQDSCRADDPGETQEEDDTQDVLHAGQVHPDERPHLWDLRVDRHTNTCTRVKITLNDTKSLVDSHTLT